MNLTPENVSKRYIESWKQTYIPHKRVISPYLKGRDIKAISKFFGFSNELTVSAIIDFLLIFGCNLDDFSEQHKFMLSLFKICVGEHNPNIRWDKAKNSLCEFITRLSDNNPLSGAYAILRKSRFPIKPAVNKSGITMSVHQDSFIECCLRTIILFNLKNVDAPSNIYIDEWKRGNPNFHRWNFKKEEILIKVTLNNDEVYERSLQKTNFLHIWEFKEKFYPSYFLFSSHYGTKYKLTKNEIKLYLMNFGLPKDYEYLSKNICEETIRILFHIVSFEAVNKWLKVKIGESFESQSEIENEFKNAYDAAINQSYLEKYLPEVANNWKSINVSTDPYWNPDNKLLNLEKLRIELGELYFSKLSKEARINVFNELIPILGFDLFNYEQFRNLVEEWGIDLKYNSIQSIIKSLKKVYTPSKQKKQNTQREYALNCLKVIKFKFRNKCSIDQACKVIARNQKNEKTQRLSVDNISSKSIRRRLYDMANTYRIKNLRSEKNLQTLYDQLIFRYNFNQNEF